jgi:hypothetical protein
MNYFAYVVEFLLGKLMVSDLAKTPQSLEAFFIEQNITSYMEAVSMLLWPCVVV